MSPWRPKNSIRGMKGWPGPSVTGNNELGVSTSRNDEGALWRVLAGSETPLQFTPSLWPQTTREKAAGGLGDGKGSEARAARRPSAGRGEGASVQPRGASWG